MHNLSRDGGKHSCVISHDFETASAVVCWSIVGGVVHSGVAK